MGSIGNCCCTPPCSTCDESLSPALSSIEFSSPDGLHPISFEADLRGAKPVIPGNAASALNVFKTYTTDPAFPMNANNASCRFPGEGLSWINDSGTTDNMAEALDASCCWAGLAIPEEVATSAGRQHHMADDVVGTISTNTVYTYNGVCATGTWDSGTYDTLQKYYLKATGYAKRFVFGVSLRACWRIGPYGTPILRLTARVFYKDYVNYGESAMFYRYDSFTGAAAKHRATFPPPGSPVCVLDPALPSYAGVVCGVDPFTEVPDATVPNPTQCLDCDPATVVNLTTQPYLTPNNCNVEFIERSIDINTDTACSLIGTHTFNSGLPASVKRQVYLGCIGTVLPGPCVWIYETGFCPPPSGFFSFPTSSSACRLPIGSEVDNYSLVCGTVTANLTIAQMRNTGDGVGPTNVIMNWWTEPWVITIS
jgi:hypothetical protein